MDVQPDSGLSNQLSPEHVPLFVPRRHSYCEVLEQPRAGFHVQSGRMLGFASPYAMLGLGLGLGFGLGSGSGLGLGLG